MWSFAKYFFYYHKLSELKVNFFVQVQASVALKRIDKFMNSEELKSDVEKLDSNSTNGHSGSGQTETTKNAVEIEEATFQWESNQVQWGSLFRHLNTKLAWYSGDLKFGVVWILNDQ